MFLSRWVELFSTPIIIMFDPSRTLMSPWFISVKQVRTVRLIVGMGCTHLLTWPWTINTLTPMYLFWQEFARALNHVVKLYLSRLNTLSLTHATIAHTSLAGARLHQIFMLSPFFALILAGCFISGGKLMMGGQIRVVYNFVVEIDRRFSRRLLAERCGWCMYVCMYACVCVCVCVCVAVCMWLLERKENQVIMCI